MAKICSQCSCKNKDKDAFCQACGAALTDAIVIDSDTKAKRIKQEQDPIARKLLIIILIAASLLCLFTTFQYISGSYSIELVNTFSPDLDIELDDISNVIDYLYYSHQTRIFHRNSWRTLFSTVERIINFGDLDIVDGFTVLSILSQLCSTITYLLLSALTVLATVLVFLKSKSARIFVWIAAIAGLFFITFGSVLGYFLVLDDLSDLNLSAYNITKLHLVPSQTIWLLLPLFIQMPILALMLPAKNKDTLPE